MRLFVESIEPRRLLSAAAAATTRDLLPPVNKVSVYGYAFNDREADGAYDTGSNDSPVAGATAFIDVNRNGALDADEPSAVSTDSGLFVIGYDVPADGSYAVGVIFPDGYTADDVTRDVQLSSTGRTYVGYFGGWQYAKVSASAFEDGNADGAKNGDDQPLTTPTIYADLNDNRQPDAGEPSATPTIANGLTATLAVKPGRQFTVRANFPNTYTPTKGYDGVAVNVLGGFAVLLGDAFGGYRQTPFAGTVYQDNNADGLYNAGDTPLANRSVYLDKNGNNALDDGELAAISDASGRYEFTLSPGTYTIRQALPAGWRPDTGVDSAGRSVTVLSGYRYVSPNFGSLAATGGFGGNVFDDFNANGAIDAGETTSGAPFGANLTRPYVDLNNDGVRQSTEPTATPSTSGAYTIVGLAAGTYTVRLDLSGAANYRLFATTAATRTVTVTAGLTTPAAADFGVQRRAYVGGRVMIDANASGFLDYGETAVQSGVTVYVDANRNGTLDAGEPVDVTDSSGMWGFDLAGGSDSLTYAIRQILPGGYSQTAPGSPTAKNGYVTVTVYFNNTNTGGRDFLNAPGTATSSVSGFLYNDANGNGTRDAGEGAWLAYGTSVYLDLNMDGVYQSDEPYAYTGGVGKYQFNDLPFGLYTLRVQGLSFPGNAVQTSALNGLVLNVTAGGTATGDVGVRLRYTVAGFVVNDLNGNGVQDSGETSGTGGSVGVVYVDANNNGTLDSGETSTNSTSDGWWFSLSPGTYTIRQQLPAGVVQTSPTNNAGLTVVVPAQPTATLRPGNFLRYTPPVVATGSVRGTVYVDENLTEERDAFEVAYSGVIVYADANNNGKLDAGEASAVSDATGAYTLGGLATGNYLVRLVAPPNFMASPAAGRPVAVVNGAQQAGVDLGIADYRYAVVSGRIFYDANADGVFNEGDSNLSGDLYVDTNNNGYNDSGDKFHASTTSGTYSLKLPATGSTYTLRLDSGSDYVNTTPKVVTFTPAASSGYTIDFGLGPKPTAATLAVSGMVYNDANKNYKRDAGEAGVALAHVFIDTNANGVLDDADYATYTNSAGYYAFPAVAATGKAANIRVVLPSGYTQKFPNTNNNSYPITLTAKANLTAKDFGLVAGSTPPPVYTASVSGTVFNDADKSGTRGTAEAGVSGVTVFADLDNDGLLDANEARTTSGSTGAYTLVVPVNAGATTNVVVRSVLPSGYSQQLPAAGYALGLAPGGVITSKDVGLYKSATTPPAGTAGLSGTAFNDNNANAKYDTGDAASKAISVFLDLDNDGLLDANEKSVLTDSSGKFSFTGLAAGTYHVRRVMPSGYAYSTTKIDVTLTSGQSKTGLLIGTKKA